VEIQRILEEAGPEASRVFLAEFTARDDLPVPELLLEALSRLPATGSFRGMRDVFAARCIGMLKDDVPDSHPRKGEIHRRWDEMQSRLPAVIPSR
jgi:hypothetical protein